MTVPAVWPGSTIVCLGCGPSLTRDDIVRCANAGAKIIAINRAWELAPMAHVLYSGDWRFWLRSIQVPDSALPPWKFSIDPLAKEYRPSVVVLQRTGATGLETSPRGLRSGCHSGYQAINLGVHFGPKKILLLGYDMKPDAQGRNHFHVEHPDGSHVQYERRLKHFETLVEPLARLGVQVLNATPDSAISTFPRVHLAVELQTA